jgi:hypothetical protein
MSLSFISFSLLYIYRNGKSRAGVYCAANLAIEQVVAHEEVDIFNAVKTVRRHRPALIENIVSHRINIFSDYQF